VDVAWTEDTDLVKYCMTMEANGTKQVTSKELVGW